MGSTNFDSNSDIRRFRAREVVASALSRSRDNSPVTTGKSHRREESGRFGVTEKSSLSPTGRVTTSKGHTIVSPNKVRLQNACELEEAPISDSTSILNHNAKDFNNEDEFVNHDSGRQNARQKGFQPSYVSLFSKPTTKPYNGIKGSNQDYEETNADNVNQNNETYFHEENAADSRIRPSRFRDDDSFSSRNKSNDRPRRSPGNASSMGNVTGSHNVATLQLAAQYEKNKNKGEKHSVDNNRTDNQSGRRRRKHAQHNGNFRGGRSDFQERQSQRFQDRGSTPIKPHISFHPTYIQPVEQSTYRSPFYTQQSRRLASQPQRKMSMNRFDSSSSSSSSNSSISSSSESENEAPNRGTPIRSENIEVRARISSAKTPDTSDNERRPTEGRRRRTRRQRIASDNKPLDFGGNQLGRVTVTERGHATSGIHLRGEEGLRRRNKRINNIPMLEGKYVTLPDNYTHSEFSSIKSSDLEKTQDKTFTSKHEYPRSVQHQHSLDQATPSTIEDSCNAAGRNEVISGFEVSSYSDKQRISPDLNAAKLIISSETETSHCVGTSGNRSFGQASSPTDKLQNEDPSASDPVQSKHVDLSDSSPELDRVKHISSTISEKANELQSSSVFGSRRNSSEARALGNIRSLFENHEAPKGDFGQTFVKKEVHPPGSNTSKVTKSNTQDSYDNGVVQSQPMLSARKIGEHYWPRDEVTQRLLSRKTAVEPTALTGVKNDYEPLTMQDTIDQLHKFADDETPVLKSKSRSNSTVGLADSKHIDLEENPTVPDKKDPSNSQDSVTQTDNAKQAHYTRRNANHRPGKLNLSKVQMVKISPLDISPCMSSTETLKECSSGEYQGRDSRSHSIDSIASNPEPLLQSGNSLKDKNLYRGRKIIHEQKKDISSDLFIVEGLDDSNDGTFDEKSADKDTIQGELIQNSVEVNDTNHKTHQKSMVMQVKELTASLKKFKLAGPPTPINNSNTTWQRATAKTDPILSVSPRGNVTRVQTNLETLSEDPEPPSPDINMKEYEHCPEISHIASKSKKLSVMHDKEESLDIDEGIVTEEDINEDPHSYLKLDDHLDERNRRRNRTKANLSKDSNGRSTGNESNRSLSDPMSNRKRSAIGEKSMDSNLLGSLQKQQSTTIPDSGTFNEESTSSLSVYSERVSLCGDSAVAELNETPELDQSLKIQSKSAKKKSFSDPNPKGQFSRGVAVDAEIIQESDIQGLQSASSEPNVMEQTDQLGDLDQFKVYANKSKASKSMDHVLGFTEDTLLSVRNQRKNVSMKSRIRAENEAMNNAAMVGDGNSIIGKLLGSNSPKAFISKSNDQAMSGATPSVQPSPPGRQGPQSQDNFENVAQQFFKVYDSMTGAKDNESMSPDKVLNSVHSRSNSEPADMRNSGIKDLDAFMQVPPSFNRGRRSGITQAPSMDNVGNRFSEMDSTRSNSEISNSPSFSPPHHHTQSMDTVFSSTLPKKGKVHHDMRLHVVKNLVETEESYVQSLQILFEDYMKPLKHPDNHSTCEPRLVDEMFHKIPQLLQHHEKFCEDAQECYHNWNNRDVQLGELFLNSFNKDALLETYTSYIKNYLNAREAVRTAMQAKTAFKIFIEQCQRENKDKQGLADLMIKPVQRIPRYELIIKDLLKHTPEGHQDRAGLLRAEKEIHTLAEQMNRSEKEAEVADKLARLLQDIEQNIEGCIDLCVPKRRFLRQDIIVQLKSGNKKDRSLWLFNDLILCTTAKKGSRTASLRRSSTNLWSMGQDRPPFDFSNKYKFLWKFPLEDVENLKANSGPVRSARSVDRQLQGLQSDVDTLNNIQKLSLELTCNHLQLDEIVRDLINHVNRQIVEKKHSTTQNFSPPMRIELVISTAEGVKTFLFEYPNEESKLQFERMFANAKRSLTTQKNRWEPTFMKAIPISKTRAGMQFSCAAPNVDQSPEVREVWVCNTDGYVGQVCFLSLESEPTQTQCITVCHAKICCIAQVPTRERRMVHASVLLQDFKKGPLANPTNSRRHSSMASNPAHSIMAWDDYSDEDNTSPNSTMSSYSSFCNSPHSTNNSASNYDMLPSGDLGSLPGAAWKKDSDGSTLHGSLEDLLADETTDVANAHEIIGGKDSMWLGTEDGKINVYPSSESVRGTKHCVQLLHSAAVHCILYHEGQVFVALSNGDLVVYSRNSISGEWNFKDHKTKLKVSSSHAISKMVVVGQEQKELWCGCQNQIKILDIIEHNEIDHFVVTQDNKRQIFCMVCFQYGVWVALEKRPQIKLFHTVSHDLLADIDVSSPVSKMLASADAIIRQHKAACLRITALLVCKDLLWVGTSAGVVLTLTLPKIGTHTSSLTLPVMPQGLAYGHTGHVRFLTAVEVTDKENSLSRGGSRRTSVGGNKRRTSVGTGPANQPRTTMLIISGGDGYEDFRMNSTSESAGREDSTNHLLVWRA